MAAPTLVGRPLRLADFYDLITKLYLFLLKKKKKSQGLVEFVPCLGPECLEKLRGAGEVSYCQQFLVMFPFALIEGFHWCN